MLKIILLIFFSLSFLYNFYLSRNLVFKEKRGKVFKIVSLISLFVFIFLAYTYDGSFLSYLLAGISSLLIFSLSSFTGMCRGGVVVLSSTFLLKFMKFSDFKAYRIKEDKKLLLIINAHSNEYKQNYDIRDREEMMKIIKEGVDIY